MTRWMVLVAGVLGMIGVMIGAFAAHGLEKSLGEQGLAAADISKRLEQCDVAVRYHMLHTLAVLVLAVSPVVARSRLSSIAAVSLLLGIALFSGGLYSMVFLGEMGHWAIVPSGGLCFIIGWCCVAAMAFAKGEPSVQ